MEKTKEEKKVPSPEELFQKSLKAQSAIRDQRRELEKSFSKKEQKAKQEIVESILKDFPIPRDYIRKNFIHSKTDMAELLIIFFQCRSIAEHSISFFEPELAKKINGYLDLLKTLEEENPDLRILARKWLDYKNGKIFFGRVRLQRKIEKIMHPHKEVVEQFETFMLRGTSALSNRAPAEELNEDEELPIEF